MSCLWSGFPGLVHHDMQPLSREQKHNIYSNTVQGDALTQIIVWLMIIGCKNEECCC